MVLAAAGGCPSPRRAWSSQLCRSCSRRKCRIRAFWKCMRRSRLLLRYLHLLFFVTSPRVSVAGLGPASITAGAGARGWHRDVCGCTRPRRDSVSIQNTFIRAWANLVVSAAASPSGVTTYSRTSDRSGSYSESPLPRSSINSGFGSVPGSTRSTSSSARSGDRPATRAP